MSNSSYNFKDNLTVDNNKYLKWLDNTGTSRANIITLNADNNVNINGAFGNMSINSNNPGSYTFINHNNVNGDTVIGTRLGIGFTTTSNMTSTLTLVKNGHIGINTTTNTNDGYLGLVGSSNLPGNSRLLLYGNNHTTNPGQIHLYSGNVTSSSIKLYTGNDSLKMQILQNGTNGTISFIPDGITSRLTINDLLTTFTNDIIITSTTESTNSLSGALQIRGGVGILGNLYIDGTMNVNNGNINFNSSQISNSYTSGAIFLTGGMGISATENSSSHTSGGALSIAGGAAIGKDVYIGGKMKIIDTTVATSSQNASLVLYGGMGINGAILSRSDESQIQIAPKTSGLSSEIIFYSQNDFSSVSNVGSHWRLGQNVNSVGPGKFCIYNSDFGTVISSSYDGQVNLHGSVKIFDTKNSTNASIGGALTVLGGAGFNKDVYIGENLNITQNTYTNTITAYSTENATGVGTGGSLNILGGASISKDLFIGGTVTSSSDIRLKTNITDFKNEPFLNKIDDLRTIKYNYINDESQTPYIGFIAQDFIKDFPELLRRPQNGYYSLDYQKMSVVLLECIKELKDKIKILEDEYQQLKTQNPNTTTTIRSKRGKKKT